MVYIKKKILKQKFPFLEKTSQVAMCPNIGAQPRGVVWVSLSVTSEQNGLIVAAEWGLARGNLLTLQESTAGNGHKTKGRGLGMEVSPDTSLPEDHRAQQS